jgi:uncharacterized oxidoreductase
MNLTGNTILVTGGASGIGLALVKRFIDRGNEVIICGRREDKLSEAKTMVPGVVTRACDVGEARSREDMMRWTIDRYPDVNVLINNAGIQRRIDLTADEDWETTRSEIQINFDAPIHLAQLFYPHFAQKEHAAIVNVTSGLSFMPLANVPVYCATKAALHSFTLSLRWQMKDSHVRVIEIIPPAVDTDLQAPGLHTFGVNVDQFADHVLNELEAGIIEIAYGSAHAASQASRETLDEIYQNMNSSFH